MYRTFFTAPVLPAVRPREAVHVDLSTGKMNSEGKPRAGFVLAVTKWETPRWTGLVGMATCGGG